MANKTLLNAVNEILKRVSVIAGDANALTSLTDSARQVDIDQAVQVVNEAVDELYSVTEVPMPSEQAESTIVLVTGTRAYSLASDLSQMRWPLVDKTNTQFIFEYPGGYNGLLLLDPEQDDTGTPHYGSIRPTDGKLHLNVAADSTVNGSTYTYQYDKDLGISLYTDTLPFGNPVFRAMVPAWVQLWKRERRNEFDAALFKESLGRAARLLTQAQPRDSWLSN
jgi:hypothetical protein